MSKQGPSWHFLGPARQLFRTQWFRCNNCALKGQETLVTADFIFFKGKWLQFQERYQAALFVCISWVNVPVLHNGHHILGSPTGQTSHRALQNKQSINKQNTSIPAETPGLWLSLKISKVFGNRDLNYASHSRNMPSLETSLLLQSTTFFCLPPISMTSSLKKRSVIWLHKVTSPQASHPDLYTAAQKKQISQTPTKFLLSIASKSIQSSNIKYKPVKEEEGMALKQ